MPTISCILNLSGYATDIYCHVKASVDYFVKLLSVESILYSLLLCKLDHICKIVHTYKYIHSLFHLRQSLFPVSYISTCPKQNCSNKISLSLFSSPLTEPVSRNLSPNWWTFPVPRSSSALRCPSVKWYSELLVLTDHTQRGAKIEISFTRRDSLFFPFFLCTKWAELDNYPDLDFRTWNFFAKRCLNLSDHEHN